MLKALRLRWEAVQANEGRLEARWRNGKCESKASVVLDDWVRRLALDWPLAAAGTASGKLCLLNLERGQQLAHKEAAHPARLEGTDAAMQLLYGDFDGGGITAIALLADLVISAGREGGALLWKIERPEGESTGPGGYELSAAGVLRCDAIVSSLAVGCRENAVWTAALDGTARKWQVLEGAVIDGTEFKASTQLSDAALCLALCEAYGLVACGTADGTVHLLDAEHARVLDTWQPFPGDGSGSGAGVRARSVCFVSTGNKVCVVAGGSNGALHLRWLANPTERDRDGVFDQDLAAHDLLPAHQGSVVALQARGESGLLISGAHDGTMRVWDVRAAANGEKAGCLYGIGGYKVWLGSIGTDGRRLVSDGSDNCIVVHDFVD